MTTPAPTFTLDPAKSKFAAVVLRMFAELTLAHTNADEVEYLEACEIAEKMDEWRDKQGL